MAVFRFTAVQVRIASKRNRSHTKTHNQNNTTNDHVKTIPLQHHRICFKCIKTVDITILIVG